MFDTAVVHARAADRKLLIVSVIGHSAIVVAVLVATLASTRLPDEAPKQMLPVFFSAPLPVMSNPVPVQPRTAAPPKGNSGQARLPVLHTLVAPQVIPDAIPTVAPAATGPESLTPSNDVVGVPDGKENSRGNDVTAPASTGPLPAGIGGVTAPVAIHRVEPLYPPLAIRSHLGGWVVLQCIIDTSGHIRDVQVVNSSFGAFEQPAIDAVRQWVFTPGQLNGQAVDVIFELKVKFEVR